MRWIIVSVSVLVLCVAGVLFWSSWQPDEVIFMEEGLEPEDVTEPDESIINEGNQEWRTFSEEAGEHGSWNIRFEYPAGYSVLAGSTDSFTGYDLIPDGENSPKLRILIVENGEGSQAFLASLSDRETEIDGVTIMYVSVGENPIYEPPVELVHVAGFSSLDSQPYGAFLIDEQPDDFIDLMQHVYETLQIVAVSK